MNTTLCKCSFIAIELINLFWWLGAFSLGSWILQNLWFGTEWDLWCSIEMLHEILSVMLAYQMLSVEMLSTKMHLKCFLPSVLMGFRVVKRLRNSQMFWFCQAICFSPFHNILYCFQTGNCALNFNELYASSLLYVVLCTVKFCCSSWQQHFIVRNSNNIHYARKRKYGKMYLLKYPSYPSFL